MGIGLALFLLTALASGLSAGPETVNEANQPPNVSITSAGSDGALIAPARVIITAEASDADGTIRAVKFFAGDELIGASHTAPYQATWRRVPAGTYALTAVAIDDHGAHTTSAPVQITVRPNTPPTVNITSPANNSTLPMPGTIMITADASDSDGSIKKVKFYVDDVQIRTDAQPPYRAKWRHPAAGTYELRAVATDNGGLSTTSATIHVTVKSGTPATAPLVQAANLVYQGAFRVPAGIFEGPNLTPWQHDNGFAQFAYGGTSLAYNPVTDSLFIVGHDQGQLVAEVDIPTLLPGAQVINLNTASVRQPFTEVTDQQIDKVNNDPLNPTDVTIKVGGMLAYQNQLYLSAYIYYDGRGTQHLSHFVSGLDLSPFGDARGPFEVNRLDCDPLSGLNCLGAGFFSGYFGLVPLEWQSALGGPVLNGNCCLGVISRSSFGPAVSTIDPAQLGILNPLPAKPLVYYPTPHPLLEPGLQPCLDITCNPIVDGWSDNSTLFNGSTEIRGVVFPEGTRSVLFFGRHGANFCYGPGTADPLLVGTISVDEFGNIGDPYCFDPEDSSKGVHGYPYAYYVWAYDANDLASVASGQKQPWEVRPYAVWPLTLPFDTTGSTHLGGATYDPQTRRLFVSQLYGDGTLPVIHVFTIPIP
ncbi:MAG: hypothetical protein AUF76_06020 [Acidobacteria bacterium 13_1_20CM_2_65_9]|nr:MAG: hypothetical protein AUF76_06020 [Acidobacteria bacterium 13_1_20CM_2_65_9]